MKKIYISSSVGMDYIFFLSKIIKNIGYETIELYTLSELSYRKFSKVSGFKKFYLRFNMYFLYPIYLLYIGFKIERGSRFIITSNTFFMPFIMKKCFAYKNITIIYLVYDLYPDALEATQFLNNNTILHYIIKNLSISNFKYSDKTVFLGSFLKEHAIKRWSANEKSSVIDISTDLELYNTNFDYNYNGKLILHYGGQIGHLHDAISLIESIKFVLNSDIKDFLEFNFYISGSQSELVRSSLTDYDVKFTNATSSEQWRNDIKNFHIGLVTLNTIGASICLPSKTYSMMAGGLAILAICPIWSDLSTLILNSKGGWVVNNSKHLFSIDLHSGDYYNNLKEQLRTPEITLNFYNTLKSLVNDRNVVYDARKNAFEAIKNNYNIKVLGNSWKQILN